MKTKLVSILLAIALVLAFATPVIANSPVTGAGKPQPVDFTGIGLSSEEISPGMWVAVAGSGSLTNHIVKPDGKATENSWFEIYSLNAYIIITPSYLPDAMIPVYIAMYSGSLYSIPAGTTVKVTLHLGNRMLITIRASDPITVSSPFNLPPPMGLGLTGTYTMIQMVDGKVIFAK